MSSNQLPTEFAPAERASNIQLHKQADFWLEHPLLQRVFDTVPDIVLILNQERQIVFANKSLLQTLGLTGEEEVLGLRPGEALGCVHAIDNTGGCGTTEFCKNCGAVRAILSSLKGKEAVEECRIIQQNGEALDLQVWATPLQVEDELFSVFAVKDISHEKRRRVLERIFFHDLLNAAGGLRGFVDILQDAKPTELDTIKDAISKLSDRLIEEINTQRELSLAENNELVVDLDPINSISFLRELIEVYTRHEVAKNRSLSLDPAAEIITFTSDPTLLRRVIGNMVKNALEATSPGKTVTLSCRMAGEEVEFSVHNPTFMPRDVQLQMFQRSFSTKGSGRGLGTYSMKLLSERYLKGWVSFTSSPDQGTVFIGRYPCHPLK
ncbi:MAG: ATP-binding protein [Anaerolineae bacterium]